MSRQARETVAVVAGLTVATAILLAHLLANITHAIPRDLRDALLNTWILAWDADRFRHGLHGLWDMPILYPFQGTLAFTEHLLGIAIFAAPIEWTTGNPVLAYNVVFFASFVFAGAAMFLFARELTGHAGAAAVAAAIFAFYPAHIAQAGHLQNLVTGWMPLSLFGLCRYIRTASRRALAGSVLAYWMQAISNGYYLFFFGIAFAIVAAFGIWRAAPSRRYRVALGLAVAGLVFAAAYAPIAREYLQVRRQYGLVRSSDDQIRFSADVGSFLTMPPAVREHLHLSLPAYPKPAGPEEAHDGMLFPGFTMIALSVVALAAVRTAALVPYATIAAIGFVLSLGPEPTIWGHTIVSSGPYGWLLAVVPGLDGLRVPARLSILVYLGLSTLAAFGARWLLSRGSSGERIALCGGLIAIAVFEGYGTIPLAEVGRRGHTQDYGLYTWLARQPAGAVLELPAGRLDSHFRGFVYEYSTLVGGHPIVNGWTGYTTDLQQLLGDPASPFQSVALTGSALDMMRGLGVRYVIVHPDDFAAREEGIQMQKRIVAARSQWIDIRQFGEAYAFTLPASSTVTPPIDVLRLVPIAPNTMRVSANRAPDLIPLLFDRNVDTGWTTDAPQQGGEWLEISLNRPAAVRLVRLSLNIHLLRDYPRSLTVETIDEQGARRSVDVDALNSFGRGFARDPMHPTIDLWLPGQPIRALRITQTAKAEGIWSWSIAEMDVYEDAATSSGSTVRPSVSRKP